jgi:hypothetical protein
MILGRPISARTLALWWALGAACLPLRADEKIGMPDLAQVEQTCLPTSTANLIIWFGRHGYPKLILSGATPDEAELHTVHQIMADTDARFDIGTEMDKVTSGIEKYIKDAGYSCTVEYRGLEGQGVPFTRDWLLENDSPTKGFILLLAYCHDDPVTHVFTPALAAGHAVTLVNAEPDMLLIHDPAHLDDETGRKIVTPHPIVNGSLLNMGRSESLAGLMLLDGSLLEEPQNSKVLLVGAVCITMQDKGTPSRAIAAADSSVDVAGQGEPVPGTGSAPANAGAGWKDWIFHYLFEK